MLVGDFSLRLTAYFEGLLPEEVRGRARDATREFDDLFLVVDQRGRWECEVLPAPRQADAAPLLIGARKVGSSWRYYLVGAFELTTVESYLGANSANE
jgi:hypothetical protein